MGRSEGRAGALPDEMSVLVASGYKTSNITTWMKMTANPNEAVVLPSITLCQLDPFETMCFFCHFTSSDEPQG
jgi:hypothetical protein